MKNETTTLKDQAKPKSEPAKPQAEVKKEAEAKKETSYAPVQSAESKKGESKSSAPMAAGSGSADKGKETQVSSQDIQDIKGLLAAINSTLRGPLSIKNNKPFRPTSNMLD
jgi:outer membrane biosynthesis protein TonB